MKPDAKTFLRQWATDVIDRHGAPATRAEFEAMQHREEKRGDAFARAMLSLPDLTYACALVANSSLRTARDQVRDIERMTHNPLNRRSYWDHINRAEYFASGYLCAAR